MAYARTFTTLGCPDFTLEQALALAEKHNVSAVEIRALGGTIELAGYLAQNYGTPAALAEKLRAFPIKIIALDTSLKLVGAAAVERDKFLALLPWSEAIGCTHLRVFDGGSTFDDRERAEAVATLRWWRELRAQHGWKTDIMVETHDTLFTADKIAQFIAAAPSTAILWDSHHTWKRGGEDPVVTWRAIKAHVAHLHVKDSISRPSVRHPYSYVLPGTGEFPMAPLCAVLRAEYSGAVSLEWEKLWHPYLPPLDEALVEAEARQWW